MSETYPVGLLYSTSGPYSAIGQAARAGALLALREVNEDPAFPFTLAPHSYDPEGAIERYPTLCETAIRGDGCRQIVGTITSFSRKEVIPTIEKHDALLWYMCPYEGFESSDNVIYTGACPNQHIVPLFQHLLPRWGTRGYLTGSNYIWGWEVNRIARELIVACGGQVVAERYLPMGSEEVERLIQEIRHKKPDFILNNLIGPSSYAFFRAYQALAQSDPAFGPERCPIVSCNLTECELALIGDAAVGHMSAAIYFESIDSAENRAFVRRVRQALGETQPVSAILVGGYSAVRTLAEAIREAGTDEPEAVRKVLYGRSFDTPLGTLTVDRRTNHVALRPHLGRILPGNRFEIVESAPEALVADPYLVDFDPEALTESVRQAGAVAHLRVVK